MSNLVMKIIRTSFTFLIILLLGANAWAQIGVSDRINQETDRGPSLEAIDLIQAECGIPVTSAAVCTTYEMMKKIGIEAKSAIGGELLSGKY